MDVRRIAIACGGTGGHLYPGLAVAAALRRRGIETRLYISEKEVDRTVMEAFPDYTAVEVPVIGWPGLHPRLLSFALRLWRGYRQACAELRGFQPDVVLGMGGFTCAPLLVAARRAGLPACLHESNAIPGKVTRLLATRVTRVLLGFEACARHLPAGRTRVTGTPVRDNLVRLDRQECLREWGLDPGRFTIAVMGGSQGARGLNDLVVRAASELRQAHPDLQWLHLTGREEDRIRRLHQANRVEARVIGFSHAMERVYSACDVVVARSGAASLSEIASYGLPSILVPYPHAAEDHQTRNADVFVGAGAALMVRETPGAETDLAAHVGGMIARPEQREAMGRAALAMDMQGAVNRVVEALTDVA